MRKWTSILNGGDRRKQRRRLLRRRFAGHAPVALGRLRLLQGQSVGRRRAAHHRRPGRLTASINTYTTDIDHYFHFHAESFKLCNTDRRSAAAGWRGWPESGHHRRPLYLWPGPGKVAPSYSTPAGSRAPPQPASRWSSTSTSNATGPTGDNKNWPNVIETGHGG